MSLVKLAYQLILARGFARFITMKTKCLARGMHRIETSFQLAGATNRNERMTVEKAHDPKALVTVFEAMETAGEAVKRFGQ